MVPRLNLFGEISETDEEIILRIAQGAAEWRGYAVYDDFNEYFRQPVRKARLSEVGWTLAKVESFVREILVNRDWIVRRGRRNRVEYYPPGTRFPEDDQSNLHIED